MFWKIQDIWLEPEEVRFESLGVIGLQRVLWCKRHSALIWKNIQNWSLRGDD